MKAIIYFTLLSAIRNQLFISLSVLVVVVAGIAHFLGTTALVEQEATALGYVAGSSRIVLAVSLIVFICFHIRRAIDNKEVEFMIARPLSRTAFIVSYWAAFMLLATFFGVIACAVVSLFAFHDIPSLLFWSASFLIELYTIASFTFLLAMMTKSVVTALLSSLGFYVLARMVGFFMVTLASKRFSWNESAMQLLSEWSLKIASMFFPRFDLLTETSWLIYGVPDTVSLWAIFLQPVIYVPLLLVATIFDFHRKHF